ncbi:putative cell morphogenesis protein [Polychaeton citri CBS 116435]|uniref:Cell morphogenesis protein n=1 Tax=Polychaeton citri CBS 116435 TaxID=1314669 RepID=A0A9P4QB73_9PEZI|nr:putative cell morphogenesis protein [Polychaeton citri CBS 116435]
MAVSPQLDGRSASQEGNGSPPPEPLLPSAPTQSSPASRDPSTSRGRALSSATPRNASPRGVTPASTNPAKQSFEVERKASVSYGHHRQTSIVHGIQHSRNTSLLAANSNPSPLSPNRATTATGASEASGLRKSPSATALHVDNINGGGMASGTRSFERSASRRGPQRMHSGRIKPSAEHSRTQSRQGQQPEPKTVGEYALHHLFTSFIAEADERIERCVKSPGEPEPRIEQICGPGADPAFDQLISSLGHINRHKPKSLIDSVIHWRKNKANLANKIFADLQTARDSGGSVQRILASGNGSTTAMPEGNNLHPVEHDMAMAERRSAVSVYILCRVLIEIIGQTSLKALNGSDATVNTADRLEDVIYGQVQGMEPDQLSGSPLKHANWIIRGQLLGVMSGLRFEEVSDRFLKDLEKAQRKLSVKGLADPKVASSTALLVQSMRWLKVQFNSDEAWNHSCGTMRTLGRFFAEVHGRPIKHAYAELFEYLMLPIAANATYQLNSPKWKEVVETIYQKVSQMITKADHWPHVFPLQAVLLCVSPTDVFANQWLQSLSLFQPKPRDRAARSHALKAMCRLVWRYLYRLNDSQNHQVKKLEEVVRLVFQGGKRVLISTDPAIADPLIQLIRIIGYKHQDLCFRTIIFPLMNSELFNPPDRELRIESLDPEKTVIAIRAFLAIMADLERNEPPPFPTSFECDTVLDPSSRSPITHRRTRSQGFAVSAGRTERLSRPVMTNNFPDVAKDYYVKFCKILGQLTIICDNTFGGQAVLDEKFASQTPKTPMAEAFAFNRRDDIINPTDVRQHYYDLLHVAVEALPRCLSPHLPINSLVNLLCTGTAHVQSHIATSSAQSLKSIARQHHAQQVTVGFARFIFNFDDRYATVSDGGLLGPGHIENTLKLYVELLQIWIDEIQKRARKAATGVSDEDEPGSRILPLDLSSILAHVDEIESHGLFFLCSPSRTVRAIATNVLRLITRFDTALGKPSVRVITILQGSTQQVIDVNDERLTLAERSRLQKGLRKSSLDSTLVELCSSDVAHDQNLWFKAFPNLIQLSSEICLHAVALTREIVCQRLSHSHRMITALADGPRQTAWPGFESNSAANRFGYRHLSSSPDIIIEQWKLHLIFACTTLTNIGSQVPKSSQSSQHTRKSSKSSSHSQDKIANASELFQRVVHFLGVPNPAVRSAAVVGLGATNATLFQTLLECLHPLAITCSTDAKERLAAHQRSISSPRRSRTPDVLRTEITRLLSLTSHVLNDPNLAGEDFCLAYLADYAKQIRIFLSDADIQVQLEFQKLRTHFCTLVESLYEAVRKTKDPSRWMSFQSRQATFSLIENWCGFSPNEPQIRRQEDSIRRSILEREMDYQNRGIINAAIEKEKSELQTAALNAMACLCAGPLAFVADGKVIMQFDVRRIVSWISGIFDAQSDRIHMTGRKALQNMITHNAEQPFLMSQAMRMCYTARTPKALHSYFEVVTKVLVEDANASIPFWKVLSVGLYTLGNEDSQIRMKSAKMLRTLEERQQKSSKLQDFDIRVSDKTTAVYKLAQFNISCRLAKQHPELAFHVFSEFSAYFNELHADHQRNMVSGMLPWIQAIELQLDPGGGPSVPSYMLLVNLFEITVKSSITLHNEVQALWQALATGPYAGNVQLVLDFIMGVCLERKEQNFVVYAKQIVVFLSGTAAGVKVIDYLLMQIAPKYMVAERRNPIQVPTDVAGLPYVADLSTVLPSGARQNGLAQGQLSMILLVDLIVSPDAIPPEKLSALLQIVIVQWDQYASIVQDQAREMLVHLIHELVISKIEPGSTQPDKNSIEDFIDAIRRHDPKTVWQYSDSEVNTDSPEARTVPEPMAYVVDEVVRIFAVMYPGIREAWGRTTQQWATSCAVRHVACRSFQIFRCIQTTLDQQILSDMLARLSNTIADDKNHDYLVFSLEILTTLRSIIDALAPLDLLQYPQLFWVTCACLDTIFEREFQEGLTMLGLLLTKMDLSDPAVLKILRDTFPSKWEGSFQGLHTLVYKGIRSSRSMGQTLSVMDRLVRLTSSDIIGGEERLLFTVLANLPRFLRHFEDESSDLLCIESAELLAFAAESLGHVSLGRALAGFARGKFRNTQDFLVQTTSAIRTTFFPVLEFQSLVFLLGMCNNASAWFKVNTMQVLCVLVPDIDMRKPEIASQGPDLISPLLRLLQTEHYQQALDVLDNVIEVAGTPLDHKHIRMSMAGSHSTRATRKEYESTKSLYGIPEASGWSVPMPAIHSGQTRANVHAVFYTLSYQGVNGAQETTATPEIEFHRDDYESYFGDRTTTMLTDDTRADGNMGDLAVKLDNLDDFFDDEVDGFGTADTNGRPHYASAVIEERQNLYDQEALPILHRSLKRNASVTSFQTGFAEQRYPTPAAREPPVMTPGAFAHSAVKALGSARPGLHNRSITSPAMTVQLSPPRSHHELTSGDEAADEPDPFSDDELSIGRAQTADQASQISHVTMKASGIRAGFKQGLRRLTSSGSRGDARDALRGGTGVPSKSPRVPKVPAVFLRDPTLGPMSAEP